VHVTQPKGQDTSRSLIRPLRTIATIALAEAVLATVIALATSGRTIYDFQRVFMTVGGVGASFGILAMGSSRWSQSGEIAAEKMAMARRRPRPPGDLALRRAMFLLVISSALLTLVGYGLPAVFSR
jgi:hypothetical protein